MKESNPPPELIRLVCSPLHQSPLEPPVGIEPTTSSLQVKRCYQTELRRQSSNVARELGVSDNAIRKHLHTAGYNPKTLERSQ
jgi:hypothetical protein